MGLLETLLCIVDRLTFARWGQIPAMTDHEFRLYQQGQKQE
jgi:hypothetical protein